MKKAILIGTIGALCCYSQINVKTSAGATGNGKTVDGPAIQNLINANAGASFYFPPGNYLLNNTNAIGLNLNAFTGELYFAPGAKLICNDSSTTAGWCVNIQNSNNVVIRGMWVGYSNETGLPLTRSSATNGAVQIWNSSNVRVYSPHVNASTGLGFISGISTNVQVFDAEILNTTTDGLSFINDKAGFVDGLYTSNTGDDGLSVINYLSYANNTGFTGSNIQIYGSATRGISVPGQSDVTITNFLVSGAAASGIITLDDTSWSTRRPSNVSWSNGIILGSGLYGIQIDSSDNLSFNNIQISKSAEGGWYGCTSKCSNIQASNITVNNSTNGAGIWTGNMEGGQFSHIQVKDVPSYGFYSTALSDVTFSDLVITDVSQTDSLHRAWWVENSTGSVILNGAQIVDDTSSATGYVVGEYNNSSHAIRGMGILSHFLSGNLSIQKSSANATITAIN